MDIFELVALLMQEGRFREVAVNPYAQFGTATRQYVFSEILPERQVDDLMYEEAQIYYTTVIASMSSRFSDPVIKRAGELVGTMKVALTHSSLARELTAKDYEDVVNALRMGGGGAPASEQAAAMLLGLSQTYINQALVEYNEALAGQALVNGIITRKGPNGQKEVLEYVNPTGHRISLVSDWTDPNVDPMDDLIGIKEFLMDKGKRIRRIIARNAVRRTLLRNPNMKMRGGAYTITPDPGTPNFQSFNGSLAAGALDAILANEELPAIEVYDGTFQTEMSGRQPFMPAGSMLIICDSDRDVEVLNEMDPTDVLALQGVLGYTAIGPVAAAARPGRKITARAYDNHVPYILFEGSQASAPVIQSPESVVSLTNINTTPA